MHHIFQSTATKNNKVWCSR